MSNSPDAIVLQNVVKSFRKSTIRKEHTTFKSELMRWLRPQRDRAGGGTIAALRGIDLCIPRGKTVGILGRNGSGKSTLLKLITGIYSPTSGSIQVNGRVSALLDLGAGFHPDFSGRENILINGIILGMSRAEVRARMDEIIAFSELGDFVDEPVRTYSSGMYMRLAFAVATHVDPDILIIDEILAVGDEHFAKKSLAKMTEFKRQGKTIVLVTHDLSTVERWCDLAAWIDGGHIRRVGPPAELVREYRDAVALAEARSETFAPPALSESPATLPEVASSGNARAGLLQAMTLLDAQGQPCTAFETERPFDAVIDLPPQVTAGWELELRLSAVDGRDVYATRKRLGSSGPADGSVQRLRFHVDRLGLLEGDYVLNVHLREARAEGRELGHRFQMFRVSGRDAESGLFRPPHVWSFESEAPPERRLGGVT